MKRELKLFIFCVLLLVVCSLLIFISNNNYKDDSVFTYDIDQIYYFLDNDGYTILNDEYVIYDNYSDYQDFDNLIDEWADNRIDYYSNSLNSSINTNLNKDELIREYKQEVNSAVNSIKDDIEQMGIDQEYFETDSLLIFEYSVMHKVLNDISVVDICKNEDVLKVYIDTEYGGVVGGGDSVLYFVKIDRKMMRNISDVNFDISENDTTRNDVAYKPIIYLYPLEETNISVSLGYEDKIFVSYPKYTSGWRVNALPDGTLFDLSTNKELYALYYESYNTIEFKVEDNGFVVAREDVVPFLEEKLELLGLNTKEREEFIIYWLPILENNKYNYIRFATKEEIDINMPLEISPVPDTTIRILMIFKALEEPISVDPQIINKVERSGYTAVEWGATIIK